MFATAPGRTGVHSVSGWAGRSCWSPCPTVRRRSPGGHKSAGGKVTALASWVTSRRTGCPQGLRSPRRDAWFLWHPQVSGSPSSSSSSSPRLRFPASLFPGPLCPVPRSLPLAVSSPWNPAPQPAGSCGSGRMQRSRGSVASPGVYVPTCRLQCVWLREVSLGSRRVLG